MNISTENFNSTEVHPSNYFLIYEALLVKDLKTFGLLFCNLLFGVPIHSYVLWLIAQRKIIPSEFFNVNLTVCEIIYCTDFFLFFFKMFVNPELPHRFLQGLGITGRPLFQCLMCVERYLAVIHPVIFLKFKPLRYRVICCTLVWIITLGSCLATLTIQISSNMKAYTWFFSLQFILFLSIELFCLVAVLRALKQSRPGERRREKEEENPMKRRAFHLILITTVTLVVMFVPYIITGLITVLQQKEYMDVSVIWFFSLSCFILAGFVQPVLYLHRVGKLICLSS